MLALESEAEPGYLRHWLQKSLSTTAGSVGRQTIFCVLRVLLASSTCSNTSPLFTLSYCGARRYGVTPLVHGATIHPQSRGCIPIAHVHRRQRSTPCSGLHPYSYLITTLVSYLDTSQEPPIHSLTFYHVILILPLYRNPRCNRRFLVCSPVPHQSNRQYYGAAYSVPC